MGLSEFIEEPIFDASLFVTIRKRLGDDFFNLITREVAKVESNDKEPPRTGNDTEEGDKAAVSSEKNEPTHSGVLKVDATCCDAEMRYPTDHNLLEDGSAFLHRMLLKFCLQVGIKPPPSWRGDARRAYLSLIKKRHRGRKLQRHVMQTQLRCLDADIQLFSTQSQATSRI